MTSTATYPSYKHANKPPPTHRPHHKHMLTPPPPPPTSQYETEFTSCLATDKLIVTYQHLHYLSCTVTQRLKSH